MTMFPLDVRKLIRNQFKISKPTSKVYTFKKRIHPIDIKPMRIIPKAKYFSVIA